MSEIDANGRGLIGEDPGVAETVERVRALRVGELQGAYDAALRWLDEGRPDLSARALEELLPELPPEHRAGVEEAIGELRGTFEVARAVMEADHDAGRRDDAGEGVEPGE